MSDPNGFDMTCKACGGTWGEPDYPTMNQYCPADCHDPAKWKALAVLVDALEMACTFGQQAQYESALARIAELEKDQDRPNVFTPEQSERAMKIIVGTNTRIPQLGQRRALIALKDICYEAIDGVREEKP